jgi:hydrogenase maturation factor HypF (carbamoyltransferase family)
MTARYLLVRYERCTKCQRALNVEVAVDPLTRHYHIQPGTCGRCTHTR